MLGIKLRIYVIYFIYLLFMIQNYYYFGFFIKKQVYKGEVIEVCKLGYEFRFK